MTQFLVCILLFTVYILILFFPSIYDFIAIVSVFFCRRHIIYTVCL